MKFRNKFLSLFFVLVFINTNSALASTSSDAETIFNWAENNYSFFPTKEDTQLFDPWLYRYYSTTRIYLGVNQSDLGVYVLGGQFGTEPFYVDTVENILKLVGSDSNQNIIGLYTGTSSNSIFNCNDPSLNRTNSSTGSIDIISQDGVNFSGSGSFSLSVQGFLIEEIFDITGVITHEGLLMGNLSSEAFLDGEFSGSGSSLFTGEFDNAGAMTIKTPENELGIDNCKTTGTTIAVNANKVVKVIIETRILDFDPQPGMKSQQTITVNFNDKEINSIFKTGTTDFFGIPLNSVRDNFKIENMSFLSNNIVKFSVSGETASGVRVIPNINYDFDMILDEDGHIEVSGCHDGYPAYKITVDGNTKYSFKHKPKEVFRLFGDCDIILNP